MVDEKNGSNINKLLNSFLTIIIILGGIVAIVLPMRNELEDNRIAIQLLRERVIILEEALRRCPCK